jgi:hypothetical protein
MVLTPDLVKQGWSCAVLRVVNSVAPELCSESCIRPGEVWSSGGILVFTGDGADELMLADAFETCTVHISAHLVSVGLEVVLDVTVLCEPVTDLRVVP